MAEALQGRALRQKSSRGEASACTPRELWSVSYTSELSQTEAKEMGLPVSPTAYPWSGYKLQSLPVPCSIRQSGLVALEHPPWWLWEPRAHDLERCTEITSKSTSAVNLTSVLLQRLLSPLLLTCVADYIYDFSKTK